MIRNESVSSVKNWHRVVETQQTALRKIHRNKAAIVCQLKILAQASHADIVQRVEIQFGAPTHILSPRLIICAPSIKARSTPDEKTVSA